MLLWSFVGPFHFWPWAQPDDLLWPLKFSKHDAYWGLFCSCLLLLPWEETSLADLMKFEGHEKSWVIPSDASQSLLRAVDTLNIQVISAKMSRATLPIIPHTWAKYAYCWMSLSCSCLLYGSTLQVMDRLMKLKLQGLLLVKVSFEAHGRGLGHLFNLARYFVKFAKIWYSKHSRLQLLLSFTPHQDSMVLAQKQKYRPMEQHRKLRDKPMHLWAAYLWQRRQEHAMEKRQPLQ